MLYIEDAGFNSLSRLPLIHVQIDMDMSNGWGVCKI
jgi:hypothetical protein